MKRLLAALLLLLTMTACSQQAVIPMPAPQTEQTAAIHQPVEEIPALEVTPAPEQPPGPVRSPEADLYKADAEYLVALVEETHPCFALDDVSAEYAPAKEKLLAECEYAVDQDTFARLCQQYLVSLRDAHTTLFDTGLPSTGSRFERLNLTGLVEGDTFYLTDSAGNLTGETLVAVNDIPVADLFSIVDAHYVAENQAARERNRGYYSLAEYFMAMAGIDCLNPIYVTKEKDGLQKTELVGRTDHPVFQKASFVADSKILQDDVFYIDFNSCTLCPQLDDVCAKLEKAVAGGICKVIIDVRDNGGGYSSACRQLLDTLDMTVPHYGCYTHVSPLYTQHYPDRPQESYTVERDPSAAVQSPDVELVVLVNQNTFSSANMLAVWVQDGNLGAIVGRPYWNNPSSYGDNLHYTLPNTRLEGNLSHRLWLRPDATADQKTLWPDIQTELGEDALEIALAYLKNK